MLHDSMWKGIAMSSKKRRNRGKKTADRNEPTKIIFTLPVVKILKDSLANFEILLLAGENKTIPNLEFAHLTFDELKQKITDMLEGEDWGKVISFDYNEAWILYTSLAMYIVELQLSNGGDTAKLPVCLALCNQFNALIEANR
jgi:hypothetical protein